MKCYFELGKTVSETHDMLGTAFGEDALRAQTYSRIGDKLLWRLKKVVDNHMLREWMMMLKGFKS